MSMQSRTWEAVIVATILAVTVGAATVAAQGPDGAVLYREKCRACHGLKGVTPPRMLTLYPELKTLADSGAFAKLPKDSVLAAMRHGKGTHMKSFATVLNPEQMEAIATYIKSL